MRVLVTGASGFIGRQLVFALAHAGHEVRAASRGAIDVPPNATLVHYDDLAHDVDWDPLVAGCDAVVHLAGLAHVDPNIAPELYDRINHQATRTLARAAAKARVQCFVSISSIRAQSGPVANHVLTEDDPARPTDAYGKSKLAAENAVKESGLPYVILRPVVVYGTQAKGNVATLLRLAALPLPLPFGAFGNKRSLVSRDALVDAIAFALRGAPTRETFIVADRAPIALRDMIAALRRGLGRSPDLVAVPRSLVRIPLRLAGRADILDRIDGELIASPAKLIGVGWHGAADTTTALERLAREVAAPRS